jgi:C4-dicarboxylate transporter DctQ subunit
VLNDTQQSLVGAPDMKALQKLGSAFDHIVQVFAAAAAVLIIFAMVGVTTDVAARYFAKVSIFWMFEATELSLLFITFLSAAWVLRRKGHVNIDIVLNRLGQKGQALINAITSMISAIVFLIVTLYGARVSWENFQMGYTTMTQLNPPKWPMLTVISLGSLLLFLQLCKATYEYWADWRRLQD